MVAAAITRLVIPDRYFDARGIASLRVVGDQKMLWTTFVVSAVNDRRPLCTIREHRVPDPLEWLIAWAQRQCSPQNGGKPRLVLRACLPVNDPQRLHTLQVQLDIRRV